MLELGDLLVEHLQAVLGDDLPFGYRGVEDLADFLEGQAGLLQDANSSILV